MDGWNTIVSFWDGLFSGASCWFQGGQKLKRTWFSDHSYIRLCYMSLFEGFAAHHLYGLKMMVSLHLSLVFKGHMNLANHVEGIIYIYYPVMFRDYFISHEIRIPSWTNQDFMECQPKVLNIAQMKNGCKHGWSLGNEKNPCCVGYIGDYTTRLCGNYI